MLPENLILKTKNDCLGPRYEKHLDKIVELELEIAKQKLHDASEKDVAVEVLSRDAQGRPTATQKVSRGRFIEILEKELENEKETLSIIEKHFE